MIVKYNNYYYSGYFFHGVYRVCKTKEQNDWYVLETYNFVSFDSYKKFMYELVKLGGVFIRKY